MSQWLEERAQRNMRSVTAEINMLLLMAREKLMSEAEAA
jgi:hypothetical protein